MNGAKQVFRCKLFGSEIKIKNGNWEFCIQGF